MFPLPHGPRRSSSWQDVPTNKLDTYDPHVTGVIAEVWQSDDGLGRARVTNICRSNKVQEVELLFPYECGSEEWSESTEEHKDGNDPYADILKTKLGTLACIRPMPVWLATGAPGKAAMDEQISGPGSRRWWQNIARHVPTTGQFRCGEE
ncbi:hypothetical protein C8T65DRAFT_696643 [Cerioporus squamosus]|nr:hypothetical protein C8T65DRAFT_696643 [Cerioporus squamosus]